MNRIQKLIRGLQIFSEQGFEDVCAEHDVIYAGPDPTSVTSEVMAELALLGWHPDVQTCSFYFFT